MNSIKKNISYTFFSNLICLCISTIVTFLLPKNISVENYGLFQLYFFYLVYTGFLHFGWADGMYLRYGGAYYESLDKTVIGSQFKLYCALEIFFSVLFCSCTLLCKFDANKTIVFLLVGISIAFNLPKTFLLYLLQGTNKIKEYAKIVAIERFFYGLFIVAIIIVRKDSFIWAICADLFGKIVALVYAIFQCRTLLISQFILNRTICTDIFKNIKVGSKLMFANIASLLILGIIRWSIEYKWDVSVFGKISLTLSISNLIMVFIRAVSMVMLPTLRRIDSTKYSSIYNDLKTGLLVLMFGMLLVYFPLNNFLCFWLPEYADALKYMAILFPLCIFEGKSSALVETYLKTIRLEQKLLFSNIVTMGVSLAITVVSIFYLDNLTLAVFGILVTFAFKTTLGEYFLSKKLDIDFYKNIIVELGLVITFVFSTWFVSGIKGFSIFLIVYGIYVFANRDKMKKNFEKIKR